MLGMTSKERGSWLPDVGGEIGKRLGLAEREEHRGPPAGLLIAGAVVVGLGVLTWIYLGPDLKRYLKIHGM
jgi:hypothetical protein